MLANKPGSSARTAGDAEPALWPSLLLKQSLLSLVQLGRLGPGVSPRDPRVLASPALELQAHSFVPSILSCGLGGLNSGSHGCPASSLPAVPSPQHPRALTFNGRGELVAGLYVQLGLGGCLARGLPLRVLSAS